MEFDLQPIRWGLSPESNRLWSARGNQFRMDSAGNNDLSEQRLQDMDLVDQDEVVDGAGVGHDDHPAWRGAVAARAACNASAVQMSCSRSARE